MKRLSTGFLFSLITCAGCAQNSDIPVSTNEKTLLWKISGKDLEKPSYLFGTIHMLCSEDAVLSSNMKKAISNADEIYLEVDLDNMMEMLTVMTKMKMNGDTTLQDLLTKEDYEIAYRLEELFHADGYQFHMFRAFDTRDFTYVRETFIKKP